MESRCPHKGAFNVEERQGIVHYVFVKPVIVRACLRADDVQQIGLSLRQRRRHLATYRANRRRDESVLCRLLLLQHPPGFIHQDAHEEKK
jgi:hypothetical protein